jgi:hypothetical protein
LNTIKFLDFDCVPLENKTISLLVTQSVGPRIISLRFNGGENLFAELPHFVTERLDGKMYHFYGGHRLWHAPENMPRTYIPDDDPVKIISTKNSLSVMQQVEFGSGIEKCIHISLVDDKPQIIVRHMLTNRGLWPVECAPWAITQLKTGGVAILPQTWDDTDMLPNRSLTLWPYTDMINPNVHWGSSYVLITAEMHDPFKIGFPNPRGWLAYWLDGTLFVKHAEYDMHANYYDFGSSSECYCNDQFLELETMAPIGMIAPGETVSHIEVWDLYEGVDHPQNESEVQLLIEQLGLE